MPKERNVNIEERQFVVFSLQSEEFAIDIMKVREIIKLISITKLPQTPEFVEGIVNVRGEIIPVVSLRKRFGLADNGDDSLTRIVIVELTEGSLTGLIVDEVSEVLRLSATAIEPPPQGIDGLRTEFIEGIGKVDNRLLVILRMEKLLNTSEKLALEAVIPRETD
ncbi:MAG: chemotaxis protein CheW [Limnochordia bacterium]|nr:chemotaxis protein CheW [Limnochordia bacterium]